MHLKRGTGGDERPFRRAAERAARHSVRAQIAFLDLDLAVPSGRVAVFMFSSSFEFEIIVSNALYTHFHIANLIFANRALAFRYLRSSQALTVKPVRERNIRSIWLREIPPSMSAAASMELCGFFKRTHAWS